MARTPALIAVCITGVLLSGCTSAPPSLPSAFSPVSSSPISTSSPQSLSVSPSPTWSADQAAAITAVDEYRAVSQRIWSDPLEFSEKEMKALLNPTAGPEVVDSNVASYLDLKKRGLRYDGDTAVLTTVADKVSGLSYGTEVVVTRCVDQRAIRVVDKNGNDVGSSVLGYELPDFNLRQYTVQKRTTDKTFRVYGIAPSKGECGP